MSTKSDLNKSSWQLIYDRTFAEPLINSKNFIRFGMEKVCKSKGTNGVVKFTVARRFPPLNAKEAIGTIPDFVFNAGSPI